MHTRRYDNVVAELFLKFLKHKEINRRTYYTKKELEDSLFEYVEVFCNSKKPYFANNMLLAKSKGKTIYIESLSK